MSKKPAAALSANLVAVKGTATPASDMPGRAIVAAPALAVVPTDATSKPQRAAAGQGEVGDPMCQAKRGVSVGLQRRARCASPSVPCVDGPLDARGKMRGLTGGSIAIMCPAFSTRRHVRWPRWGPRSTPKQRCGFESRGTERVLWIVGSTDRHLIQLFHPGINARFRRTLADADKPPRASSWPMPSGHLVVQSRPKPRGGSIA
jgi:hypothetical protein